MGRIWNIEGAKSQEDRQGVTVHVEDIKGHKVVFTRNTYSRPRFRSTGIYVMDDRPVCGIQMNRS